VAFHLPFFIKGDNMKSSKALIYLLLGLTLSFVALRMAYSETCQDGISYIETQSGYCYDYKGCFGTLDGVISAMGSYYTGATAHVVGTVTAYLKYEYQGNGCSSYYAVYAVLNSSIVDTDGDSLPDDCDAYPDDSTPYSIKLVSYQTSDNQWNGDHVRECYETDRGDYYCIGSAYDNSLVTRYRENSAWIDPSDICTSGETSKSDAEDGEDSYENPAVSNEGSDGDADADTDSTLQSGEQSDGTETGDAALRDIIDNTGDIATNTKRIGEYARDLNAAVQNMENNLILMNERAESEAEERKEQEAAADAAQETFENFDVEAALDDQIDPTITEGEEGDYQDHGPLSEETWITEFIDSNPIKTVLDESKR